MFVTQTSNMEVQKKKTPQSLHQLPPQMDLENTIPPEAYSQALLFSVSKAMSAFK